MPDRDAVGAGRCGDPEIARTECSASTPDRVHAGARITTEGPIAPDRPSYELADSRRGAAGYRTERDFPACGGGVADRHGRAVQAPSRLKAGPHDSGFDYFRTSDRSYDAIVFSFMCGTMRILPAGTKAMSALPGMNWRSRRASPAADTCITLPAMKSDTM